MAPNLTEDEIDDLIFFARSGENKDLQETLSTLASREQTSASEILVAAKEEGSKTTCLHMATGNGHLETVKILLATFEGRPKEEKQAFLDTPNEFGNTGLHWAALGGHLGTVEFLVQQGASGGLANDRNYVPLDLANFNGHGEVAAYFLSLSGKIEGENQSGLSGAAEGVDLDGGAEEKEESGKS